MRQSQQAFFDWVLRNDPLAFILLDPVVTVHPDQVFFEVFSKDEGSYAKLGIDLGAFDLDAAAGLRHDQHRLQPDAVRRRRADAQLPPDAAVDRQGGG